MGEFTHINQVLDLISKYENELQKWIKDNFSLSKKVNEIIENSDYKPNYQINIIDTIGIVETQTSTLISLILKYNNHNGNILCRSFIEKFLVPIGFDTNSYQTPIITAETDRIDVCIQEKNQYAIIIENKLKGADFQRNQIARYIGKMRNAGYNDDKIFIVILPEHIADEHFFDCINKSVWRLPPDWKSPNQERLCKYHDTISCKCDFNISCDSCNNCEKDLRNKFYQRTIILDVKFVEWLENDCLALVPDKEIVLRSAIIQFADFIKGILNNRLNNKLIMAIVDFLKKGIIDPNASVTEQWNAIMKKIEDVKELQNGIESLKTSFKQDLIDQWYNNLRQKWGNLLKHEDKKSLGININGVWCGCWSDGKEPYWGFQCNAPSENQTDMVSSILKEAGMDLINQDGIWISWDYTLQGDEQCDVFYQTAKDLGYL